MKSTFFFLLLVWTASRLVAQIPNASFENWTNGEPDGWATSNSPPDFITITASNESHGGTKALRGQVITDTNGVLHRPIVFAGSDGGGFSVTQRYSALEGYYRFLPATADQCIITVTMLKNGAQIGHGEFDAASNTDGYTHFVAPIAYSVDSIPDWAQISMRTFCCGLASGTVFYVDDLSFANPTAVTEQVGAIPTSYKLEQNFPNPFNPKTIIRFEIGGLSVVTLKVYNILGVEVATLVNEKLAAGSYSVEWDASGQPSGVYYYQIKTEDFTAAKKLALVK
jgi:hypothetical protein